MSSVVIYFDGRILNFNNLSRADAEEMAATLKADGHMNDGSTDIGVGTTRYIVNRANIDYVEVRL
jgi:hypothetical protein